MKKYNLSDIKKTATLVVSQPTPDPDKKQDNMKNKRSSKVKTIEFKAKPMKLIKNNIDPIKEIKDLEEPSPDDLMDLEEEIKEEDIDIDTFDETLPDNISMYLSSIPERLLSAEEEIELSNRMHAGDEDAKNELITHNLRLVVSIAKKYKNLGYDMMDLIQEGNIGLMKGIDRFNPEKGCKLSTYVTWWIKQAMTRSIANTGKMIRIPVHVYEKQLKLAKANSELFTLGIENPSISQLSEQTGFSENEIREIQKYQSNIVSLQTPIGEEQDTYLGDIIADEDAEDIEESSINKNRQEVIDEILNEFPKREREIIKLRFGFYDHDKQTLQEIGNKYNLSRERIRQIEGKVLRKLRSAKYSKILRDYK